jgi:fermentation-respiration switch protein FrsA (DUF1100 family)
MGNLVMTLLMVVGISYVAIVIVAVTMQSRMLYLPHYPGRDYIATPARLGMEFEAVSLVTEDGVRLEGWYVPAPNARATLALFHGNAGNISHRLETIRMFHDLGLSVLIVDYRGYGRSQGRPDEEGTYRDARAVWRYLTETRGLAPADIVLFGRSLGAAIALELATRVRPGGLILESTFTSAPDLAATVYWYLPVQLLSRFRYPSLERIGSIRCPLLVVHSRDDEIVPYQQGRRLYDAAPEPKRFLDIRGDHNEGYSRSRRVYLDGLKEFLDRIYTG